MYPFATSLALYLSKKPFLVFLLNTHFGFMMFVPLGLSTICQVPNFSRLLSSFSIAGCHCCFSSPLIAWLYVLGSSPLVVTSVIFQKSLGGFAVFNLELLRGCYLSVDVVGWLSSSSPFSPPLEDKLASPRSLGW